MNNWIFLFVHEYSFNIVKFFHWNLNPLEFKKKLSLEGEELFIVVFSNTSYMYIGFENMS